MKRKRINADELKSLRAKVEARYRADGGVELEWRSYLPRYEDLNARIQRVIRSRTDAAMSPNILRRLFWDTRNDSSAPFNVVYLNALALYLTDGAQDHRTMTEEGKALAIPHSEAAQVAPPPAQVGAPPRSLSPGPVTIPMGSFVRPFLVAAVGSGLASFAFVLFFNEMSGYDQQSRESLRAGMTSYFGFTVFGHLAIGMALALLVRWQSQQTDPNRYMRRFGVFFPFLFLLTFYTRQLFVSTGWLVKGSACIGFFGQPDFETVAISLSICSCLFLFMRITARGAHRSTSDIFIHSSIVTLACGTVFFAISTAYNLLVSEGLLDPTSYFISPAVFSFRFPHPERLPLICFMIFTQVFLTLRFLGVRQHADEPAVVNVGEGTELMKKGTFS